MTQATYTIAAKGGKVLSVHQHNDGLDLTIERSRFTKKWNKYRRREERDPKLLGRHRSIRLAIKRFFRVVEIPCKCIFGFACLYGFIWFSIICFGGL